MQLKIWNQKTNMIRLNKEIEAIGKGDEIKVLSKYITLTLIYKMIISIKLDVKNLDNKLNDATELNNFKLWSINAS